MWRIPGLRRLRRLELSAHWRLFFYALTLTALAGLLVLWLAPDFAGLYLFGVYAIPSNSIVPVPHEPGLLYFAQFYHPVWIALAGTLGTGVAAFADYGVVEAAMRHPKINGAREARMYKWAVKWLMRYPFATCFIFALTPLPIYVVRVLAPASGYPVGRYVSAIMLGRLPRFFAIAWIGYLFPLPGWFLGALFVALLAVLFLASRSTARSVVDPAAEVAGEEIVIPDLTDPDHPRPDISSSQLPRAT
jgi:membrane protein YqaA with SNARE-associated domain